MREKFQQIPEPLQKQILFRMASGVIALIMVFVVLVYSRDVRFLIPGILFLLISMGSAASLYDRCLQHKYVVIDGTCAEIERTGIRKRIKALYLRNEIYTIKLMGIRRVKNILVGDVLRVYIADSTAVYEMDGNQVICSYLALTKAPKPGID